MIKSKEQFREAIKSSRSSEELISTDFIVHLSYLEFREIMNNVRVYYNSTIRSFCVAGNTFEKVEGNTFENGYGVQSEQEEKQEEEAQDYFDIVKDLCS